MWVSSDVLMCTASIWHMCTMSMDRYFTLKYPMRYGRNKTKTMVILKIFFVWVVSMAISSPICIHGFVDPTIVYNDGVCVPVLKDFVIYGSVFAFYIPLLIMIVTYVLTIRILWSNQQIMQRMQQTDLRPGLAQMTAQCTGFAMPQMPRLITPVTDDVNSETENFSNSHSNGGVVVPLHVRSLGNPSLLMPPPLSPLMSSSSPPQSPTSLQHQHLQLHEVESCVALTPPGSPRVESDSEDDDDEADLPSTCLLQEKSMSYKSLCARAAMSNSAEEFYQRAASPSSATFCRLSPSEKSGSFREHRERHPQHHKGNQLDVPLQPYFRRGRLGPAPYSTASDTQLPSSSCEEAMRHTFHLSLNGLEKDYKSAEWDRRFFQIQQEMDDCLRDGGVGHGEGCVVAEGGGTGVAGSVVEHLLMPNGGGHLTHSLSDQNTHTLGHVGIEWGESISVKSLGTGEEQGGAKAKAGWKKKHCRPSVPSNLQLATQYRKNPRSRIKALCRSLSSQSARRKPPPPVQTSDSDNDEADTSGSSNSDVITIRLHPPTSPKVKDSGQQSSEEMTENSVLRSVVVSSEADNTQDDSDVFNTNDDSPANDSPRDRASALRRSGKHKRLLKARFRNTLRASTRPVFKHLLSKKTASNERKASKVLGIIFLVFVTLWTPFFIVNIISVTCSSCMHGLTNDMMSVFIWMGYVASLANPIIYTMFNTAFRRTFIKILTCTIQRTRRMKFSDVPAFPSMTTTMMQSERRGTMTVLLDHRT